MPTPFTHALVGGAIAQAVPAGYRSWKTAALFAVVAVAPDVDILSFRLGIQYSSELGHRGLLHSLPFAACLALIAAATLIRSAAPLGRAAPIILLALSFGSVASHGILDAATDGGQGVALFAPFSHRRIFWEFRPIAVSPITPGRFLARASHVLSSEAAWVWLPTIALTLAIQSVRSLRGPMAETRPKSATGKRLTTR